jgi:hypothetical protein
MSKHKKVSKMVVRRGFCVKPTLPRVPRAGVECRSAVIRNRLVLTAPLHRLVKPLIH